MQAEDIKWIHVEASSRCNAWCPMCPRNQNGYGLRNGLIEQDLSIETLLSTLKLLPNCETVQLCGNDGDPVAHKEFLHLLESIPKNLNLQIHTNGSLRTKKWWKQCADILSDRPHSVYFGIDGLEDTHNIHRQGTSFAKAVDNATTFIQNNGKAVWQFIPFKHNEHQLLECMKLSQQLGFSDFSVVKSYRHHLSLARHYQTGKQYKLDPSDFYNRMWSKKIPATKETCMHLSIPSVYLDVQGKISVCCYKSQEQGFANLNELFAQPAVNSDIIARDAICQFWCQGIYGK